MSIRPGEEDRRHIMFGREASSRGTKSIAGIDADDERCFLRKGDAHPPSSAPVVEHATKFGDARAFQVAEQFGAPPVLEHGVVVVGAKSHSAVSFDSVVVNRPHDAPVVQ